MYFLCRTKFGCILKLPLKKSRNFQKMSNQLFLAEKKIFFFEMKSVLDSNFRGKQGGLFFTGNRDAPKHEYIICNNGFSA